MSFLLGIVFGIGWTAVLPELPGALIYSPLFLGAAVLVVLSFLSAVKRRFLYADKAIRLVAGICFGIAWASFLCGKVLEDGLPKHLEKRKVQIVGVVSGLPQTTDNGVSFQFDVEEAYAGNRSIALPEKILLFRKHIQGYEHTIDVGQRWRFFVRLKRPHGTMNPGGFDFERWLFERGIRATGTVVEDPLSDNGDVLLEAFVFSPMNVVHAIRSNLRGKIHQAIPSAECAGIITALVIGDHQAVSERSWDVFSRTGTSHLVAISGLHITLVTGLFAGLISFLWRRSFFVTRLQLPLLIPTQKVAVVVGIIAAVLYVLLAGVGIPARRTLVMIAIVGLALWTDRLVQIRKVLLLAVVSILLFDPLALYQPGFWLSFMAVAMILYIVVRYREKSVRQGIWGRFCQWGMIFVRVQIAVTVGLFALTLFFWGKTSIVSPVANAVAIPLFSFFVTPLALVGSILPKPLDTWFLSIVDKVLVVFCGFLDQIGNLSYSVWTVPFPGLYLLLFAMMGCLWLFAPKGWPWRFIGFGCFLPMLTLTPSSPEKGAFHAIVLDVGQGSAVLVETLHHRLLFDTGPAFRQSDAADRVIIPYLRSRGIESLDRVIVSHSDMDHSGGLDTLIKNIPVGDVMSSMTPYSADVPINPCLSGEEWIWDSVRFTVLYPTINDYTYNIKTNELSCVIKVDSNNGSLLLTGDIEESVEQGLAIEYKGRLRSDVLVSPHHGSHTSSSQEFLMAVQPKYAVFQVGYQNPYHHPHPAVLKRYRQTDASLFRSDEDGAVWFSFKEEGIEVGAMRRAFARFWHTK